MLQRDFSQLIDGIAEAGFVTGADGVIRLWNAAAEQLFGMPAASAVGRCCWDVVRGRDASGRPLCGPQCSVCQRVSEGRATRAYEMQVAAAAGPRWMASLTLIAQNTTGSVAIHVLYDLEGRRRLEQATNLFLQQLGIDVPVQPEARNPAVAPVALTPHEQRILRLLANGWSTDAISRELRISPNTARNHIEHILQKLSAHTRLEAVMKAIAHKLI